jgi:AraC-like DNA-binding protein
LAKIAAEVDRALARRAAEGAPGGISGRLLARGDGWTAHDVVCTSGPGDRPFEERHGQTAIAVVVAGTFQYRSATGRELMTPGSLLLGNRGESFECAHTHGAGDRCVAFHYTPEYLERLAAEVGAMSTAFPSVRLPPVRALAPLVARAYAGLAGSAAVRWDEVAARLAMGTLRTAHGAAEPEGPTPAALARVTRALRTIERRLDGTLTLRGLAREAGLSPFHFLRTFERVTGLTPHQYARRARLREAAARLVTSSARVIDVALDCGFADVSNFNRAFRGEFGVSPLAYRGDRRG